MSNHLRELLDCDEIMTGTTPSGDCQTRVNIAFNNLNESAEHAICFYLGCAKDIAAIDSPSLDGMTIDLPFETCWFEFDYDLDNKPPIVFGVMANAAKPVEARLSVFARINHQWNYLFTGITQENMRAMTTDDDLETLHPAVYRLALRTIRTALCAMKCINVERVEHLPGLKLQKARARNGKKPLFSFWTLSLTIPNARDVRSEGGGTHSSPRLHLRRGHPREYRPGKFCWVQPHAVGNKKLGIVHKNYAAQYSTAPVHNAKVSGGGAFPPSA